MTQSDEQPDAAAPEDPAHRQSVVVIVTRTGGFAGLRREWRVQPAIDDESRWIALIKSAPWDAKAEEGNGADRFTWRIWAQDGTRERTVELPEQAAQGPWRDLIDEVRSAAPNPHS